MIRNGADNTTDRETGAYWENQFCAMARAYGKYFTPHQFKRPDNSAMFYGPFADLDGKSGWTLPDITIWSAPGEHHEIKHKSATRDGMYGLERYRLDALVRFANTTGQKVYYTIHDWQLAGADCSQDRVINDVAHWLVADVATLSRGYTKRHDSQTYYNGQLATRETWYWTADPDRKYRYFQRLGDVWDGRKSAEAA